MRTAIQSAILASFVSLALGGLPWMINQNSLKSLQCCDFVKALPLLYNHPNNAEGVVCEWDSVLRQQGLLNEDNSVKEEEFRMRVIREALPDAKAFLLIALDKCFKDLKQDPVMNANCRSGVQELVQCIVSGLIINCPQTMYYTDKPQCHAVVEIPIM